MKYIMAHVYLFLLCSGGVSVEIRRRNVKNVDSTTCRER